MSEFANQPRETWPALRFNYVSSSPHHVYKQLIILVRILAKNVHHHGYCLLESSITGRVDHVFDQSDRFLACSVHWEYYMPDAPNSASHTIDVEVSSVFFEFWEDQLNIADISDSLQYFYFLKLHIDGISVFDEEDLDVLVEYSRSLVQNELYISKCYVLDFMRSRKQWDQRVRKTRSGCPNEIHISWKIHKFKHHLDRSQHNGWVDVSKTRIHSFDDVLSLFGRVWLVFGNSF